MNSINIIGRLTRDNELKFAQGSGVAVCKFTLAIDRDFKNKDGNKEADFLNCIIFNKAAESLSPYLTKGKLIGVTGRVQTGNYTNKENNKVYTFDVIVEKTKLLESKNKDSNSSNSNSSNSNSNQGGNSSSSNTGSHDFGSDSDVTPLDDSDIPF